MHKFRSSRGLAVIVMSACLLGCGVAAATSYSKTIDEDVPARPENCEFRIQNSMPNPEEYEEIGTINGCSGTANITSYKDGIRPKVCAAGGELVAAQVNGYGVYCLGTVFRRTR